MQNKIILSINLNDLKLDQVRLGYISSSSVDSTAENMTVLEP